VELGEKIKQARLEQGMSQRQLCGDVVTRNMLSQIENGSARPSMDTLSYFAKRLGKPVSWFLDEQTVVSANQALMEKARMHFSAGEYAETIAALEGYQAPDPLFDAEQFFLLSLTLTEQAKLASAEGKSVYARSLMEKAWQAGQSTPYFTLALQREWVLSMYQIAPQQAKELLLQLPADERHLFLQAQAAADDGQWTRSEALLELAENRNTRWSLLRGQAALAQKKFCEAKEHFHRAEEDYPGQCIPALETCYRELEDFKMAYQYACKHRDAMK